jgi:hypothetical protein
MTIFQVEIFWVVTLYIVVVGYHRFGGPCCLHLPGEVLWGHHQNCHNNNNLILFFTDVVNQDDRRKWTHKVLAGKLTKYSTTNDGFRGKTKLIMFTEMW